MRKRWLLPFGVVVLCSTLPGSAARTLAALTDDDDEPNGTAATASPASQFGFRKTARVLNVGDEDWYSFVVDEAANPVTAEFAFDRFAYDTQATLEVRDDAGNVLA